MYLIIECYCSYRTGVLSVWRGKQNKEIDLFCLHPSNKKRKVAVLAVRKQCGFIPCLELYTNRNSCYSTVEFQRYWYRLLNFRYIHIAQSQASCFFLYAKLNKQTQRWKQDVYSKARTLWMYAPTRLGPRLHPLQPVSFKVSVAATLNRSFWTFTFSLKPGGAEHQGNSRADGRKLS